MILGIIGISNTAYSRALTDTILSYGDILTTQGLLDDHGKRLLRRPLKSELYDCMASMWTGKPVSVFVSLLIAIRNISSSLEANLNFASTWESSKLLLSY